MECLYIKVYMRNLRGQRVGIGGISLIVSQQSHIISELFCQIIHLTDKHPFNACHLTN